MNALCRMGWTAVLSVGFLACGSAGPYGFSRHYSPLDQEQQAVSSARAYDPVMAERRPGEWEHKPVRLFAVVTERTSLSQGRTRLQVDMRKLQPRNLCQEAAESSCRVTVSERAFADLQVIVKLRPEDVDEMGRGSLVRVVGNLRSRKKAGADPIVLATYYRHWPRGSFVTTAARKHLRR